MSIFTFNLKKKTQQINNNRVLSLSQINGQNHIYKRIKHWRQSYKIGR